MLLRCFMDVEKSLGWRGQVIGLALRFWGCPPEAVATHPKKRERQKGFSETDVLSHHELHDSLGDR